MAAARGVPEAPPLREARERSVLLETIEEYLRRLLVDWPESMGHRPLTEPVAAARRRIAAGAPGDLARDLCAIAARNIYGAAPAAWLALTGDDALDVWAARTDTLPARLLAELVRGHPALGRSEVPLMPAAERAALETAVLSAIRADPEFARAPVWGGVPVETGALARMRAHPLVSALHARCGNAVPTRMAARLAELAALLAQLAGARVDGAAAPTLHAFAVAPGEGVAAVQTARGLLLHRARVADGRVTDYLIVAPTEWNFHPDGALARGLAGMAAADDATLRRAARLAVQALDPCVACRIEVDHA
jgi:hypothetical protein